MKSILFALLLAMPWPIQAAEEMILLDVEIFSGEDRVSNPRMAMKPGSDASILQGLDGDRELSISFHSTHLRDAGVELLIDTDVNGEHVQDVHREFAWNEPFEQVFSAAGLDPVRILVTPSRTTLEALKLDE